MARPFWLTFTDCTDEFFRSIAVQTVWRTTCQQFVEYDSERIKIGCGSDGGARNLLRTRVCGSECSLESKRMLLLSFVDGGIQNLGQSEVQKFGLTAG